MKTRNLNRGSRGRAKALVSTLVLFSLATATELAAPVTATPRHADPYVKGATLLLEKAAPRLLGSEMDNPELAPLCEAWQALPREVVRYPTVRSNHTLHVAIHRTPRSPDQPILVLLHGLLSDHLTWEYVAAELGHDYELWLVDLPGCGDSDAPLPRAIESGGYSPTAMGERVLQALQLCLQTEPLAPSRHLTLVGHSLGGTVSIRMMSAPELRERYWGVVQRVDRMVLFAPSDLAISSVPPKFLKLLGLEGWKVSVAQGLGVWDSRVRDLTLANYHRPECATREQQGRYAHVLKDRGHREAAKAMLLNFVRFDPQAFRPVWPCIDALVADYRNINVPVLIAHGAWDETLSVAMGHKLKNQIPGAWLVEIPRSSHALPTEQPSTCADLIRRFATGSGGLTVPPGSELTVYPDSPAARPGPTEFSRLGIRVDADSFGGDAKGKLP